ncbi:hypothetical protein OPV22_022246 [Ensete ventricosum]|uniref:Uncharacterized protein n=1 Tax=Ensete ventricosum TaxID=4639 RepID=A0AAV8QF63_ENSVE|nr:hypothetical protein OPV22_022246 [Ensete ventricosum]
MISYAKTPACAGFDILIPYNYVCINTVHSCTGGIVLLCHFQRAGPSLPLPWSSSILAQAGTQSRPVQSVIQGTMAGAMMSLKNSGTVALGL